MPKQNKLKPRVRTAQGVVTITPDSPNKFFITPATKQPYWKIRAVAPWGQRLRVRASTWEQALTIRKEWEMKFQKWREQLKDKTVPRVVVLSDDLNETRLAEAKRALMLLPKDENGMPDSRYKLDDGVARSLQNNWRGELHGIKIKTILPEFLLDCAQRVALPWQDSKHIEKITLTRYKSDGGHCLRIFGDEEISQINSAKRQEIVIKDWETKNGNLAPNIKAAAIRILAMLLNWLRKNDRISSVSVLEYSIKRMEVPRAMTIIEQQAYLDLLYNTNMALAGYARFYLGLRPWSELKESALDDTLAYGLSRDFKTFLVPFDSKTGFRPVACPPVATLVFNELFSQNRIYRRLHPKGYYILDDCSPGSWTRLYGRGGYHTGVDTMRSVLQIPNKESIDDIAVINRFRKLYPLRIWNSMNGLEPGKLIDSYRPDYWEIGSWWVQDFPRKTEISAYITVTDGEIDRAKTRYGNSREIINLHYRDFMPLGPSILHYQLIPTALKGKFNSEQIALPSWCQYALHSLDSDVVKEIESMRNMLPKFDPKKNYRQRSRQLNWEVLSPEQRAYRLRGITAYREAGSSITKSFA